MLSAEDADQSLEYLDRVESCPFWALKDPVVTMALPSAALWLSHSVELDKLVVLLPLTEE